ncbi:MAG TPA: hypothetical protein VGM90_21635 [Kofleriaceae bacterium]
MSMSRSVVVVLVLAAAGGCVPSKSSSLPVPSDEQDHICTDRNFAYETGYNKGHDGARLDTSWVDLCLSTDQQPTRTAYQTGFDKGVQSGALIVANVAAPPAPVAAPPPEDATLPYCSFDRDCQQGQTCRLYRNNRTVCMGQGTQNDPCVLASDCNSGTCEANICH